MKSLAFWTDRFSQFILTFYSQNDQLIILENNGQIIQYENNCQ